MQKTKLGISVGLFGAALYFSGFFGGYLVLLLLVGYVMLVEANEWLRKTAIKTFMLLISFSLITTIVGLIPSLIHWINEALYIFSDDLSIPTSLMLKIVSVITGAIDIAKLVLFAVLGIKAFNQGTIIIPILDEAINKYVD